MESLSLIFDLYAFWKKKLNNLHYAFMCEQKKNSQQFV